jgi:hypothetical protein
MKFNFKKVASVITSAVMIGSTIGLAAATNYPNPFVKDGISNVAIVVGANAATIDNIAAVDIGQNLQEELAKQVSIAQNGINAIGGDNINLATSSQKLYYGSRLNAARSTITAQELPNLLEDSKVIDDTGTEYSYKQSITPGASKIDFSTSGGDLEDPALLIEAGTDANNYLYQYTLTMNKNLDISNADVQGNNIKILGKDYTIGTGSTLSGSSKKLVLFGSGVEKTIIEGENAIISLDGKDYTIELKSIEQTGGTNYVSLSIDGSSTRRIQEGTSSKVGNLEIYAKTVHYLAKESQVSYADLNIGSTKIILQDGSSVKLGSDETSIYGTSVSISSSSNKLSALKVNISMTKATKDYIKSGDSFTDPVFGNLVVQLAGANPELNSEDRNLVKVNTDNSRNAKISFTSALAGDSGEKTIYFAHDQDLSESSVTIALADSANKSIHVVEGENIGINEYAVINAGDYGRIVKLTELPTGNLDANSKIQFEDVITGQNLFDGGLVLGEDGKGSTNIDGNTYNFKAINSSVAANNFVSITWGSGSSEGVTGNQITLFPRIKLSSGNWIALVKPVSVSSSVRYSLPGIENLANYESGLVLSGNSIKFGNVNYTVSSGQLNGIEISGTTYSINGAGVLFLEEKKSSETNNADNGDIIFIGTDTSGTSPVEISIAKPVITGTASELVTLNSDSNKQEAITRYGTLVKYDSTDNDAVTISYPDEQMYLDILLTSSETEVTKEDLRSSLGSVAVMDSEIDSVKDRNLIVLGGSCINTVAAKILGSDYPLCGSDFTDKTGVNLGHFLIKTVNSPYQSGKIAMLVAGFEGSDTRSGVKYLLNNQVSALPDEIII